MIFSFQTSIAEARRNVAHLRGDGLKRSTGDIWSIKKLLLLDYYLPSFKLICSPKYNFKEWYYVDPFCGSGLFDFTDKSLKNEVYAGSALIGAINASKHDYTNCILSDTNKENIDALNRRIGASGIQLNSRTYQAQERGFEDTVNMVLRTKRFGMAMLIFVDPDGYVPIKWQLMERLVKEVGIDVIFNFMTYTIALNASASKTNHTHEKNLNEFFGDVMWKQHLTTMNKNNLGSKLLLYYISKIQIASGKNVIPIGVHREKGKKLYDLLVITRSGAGTKVIQTAKKIMDKATTESIHREFKVQSGIQKTLF